MGMAYLCPSHASLLKGPQSVDGSLDHHHLPACMKTTDQSIKSPPPTNDPPQETAHTLTIYPNPDPPPPK